MSKNTKRQVLGRGLSNLIPVEPTSNDPQASGSIEIERLSIVANPFQPRLDFDDTEIDGLAESIAAQGLLQPVVVRKKVEGGYEIISGERRFRAMTKLGWDRIPCIVKTQVTDREMLEMALVENIQRENLNEIETALAYQQLLLECGLSHEELSKQVGKSRSAISNALRLLKLPVQIQQMLRRGELSMGHARSLLGLEDPKQQRDLADEIIEKNLSVREIEQRVQRIKGIRDPATAPKKIQPTPTKSLDPDIVQLLERLQYRFGTAVKISNSSDDGQKGKIEIHYHSGEDLTRICDLLLPLA